MGRTLAMNLNLFNKSKEHALCLSSPPVELVVLHILLMLYERPQQAAWMVVVAVAQMQLWQLAYFIGVKYQYRRSSHILTTKQRYLCAADSYGVAALQCRGRCTYAADCDAGMLVSSLWHGRVERVAFELLHACMFRRHPANMT